MTLTEKLNAYGRNLKAARSQKGITQEQLSFESGVSRQTISRIERGHDSSISTLISLATSLQVPVSTLID